jgi:hypothetical protein
MFFFFLVAAGAKGYQRDWFVACANIQLAIENIEENHESDYDYRYVRLENNYLLTVSYNNNNRERKSHTHTHWVQTYHKGRQEIYEILSIIILLYKNVKKIPIL